MGVHRNYYSRQIVYYLIIFAVSFSLQAEYLSAQNNSNAVYYDGDQLRYRIDSEKNRIPDYSHAGYKGGTEPLPVFETMITLQPSGGDDTYQIQSALNRVGQLPMNERGERGAVVLSPGVYHISSNISINRSGVVLRGAGKGNDPSKNTIIRAGQNIRGNVITIGSRGEPWLSKVAGSETEVITEFVPVGSRLFQVRHPEKFNVGDRVILRQESSEAWLNAIDRGGTHGAPSWEEGEVDIFYYRIITAISGNTIQIDAPVFDHLNRKLATTYMYKPDISNLVINSGIESLTLDIQTLSEDSQDHAETGIFFHGVENAWASSITVRHFWLSGISMRDAAYVTIEDSDALSPHSPITEGTRYNFAVFLYSNNILFKNLRSTFSRRPYIVNGKSTSSGVVFYNSVSEGAVNAAEGHRKWSQGILYDNMLFSNHQNNTAIGLYNRGSLGSSHGWSAVHSTAWNVRAPQYKIVVQKPPVGQNYAIGNRATVDNTGYFTHPAGHIELTGTSPEIHSLYEAQLQQRILKGIPPENILSFAVSNTTPDRITLRWDHLYAEPVRYEIERSTDNGKTFEPLATVRTPSRVYHDEHVLGIRYTYRLRGVNDAGYTDYTEPMSITPVVSRDPIADFSLAGPELYTDFKYSPTFSDTVRFEWEAAKSDYPVEYTFQLDEISGDFSYPVYERVLANGQNSLEMAADQIVRLFEQRGRIIPPRFQIKWKVIARMNQYNYQFTKHIREEGYINLDNVREGLQQTTLMDNFPNPFDHITRFNFYLDRTMDISLSIYNIQGQKVATIAEGSHQQGYHTVPFRSAGLASGVYFYRFITEDIQETRKLMIVK